jgi:hypothetical protein
MSNGDKYYISKKSDQSLSRTRALAEFQFRPDNPTTTSGLIPQSADNQM